MSSHQPGGFALFDLLARRWRLPAPVTTLAFDAASSTLLGALADGRLALIGAADAEPPDARIAVDAAGRRTIAPRKSEPRPAIVIEGTGVAKIAAELGGAVR